jgi:hypothetical protein
MAGDEVASQAILTNSTEMASYEVAKEATLQADMK